MKGLQLGLKKMNLLQKVNRIHQEIKRVFDS